MTCLYAAALTVAPGPAWIEAALHRPERVARVASAGFRFDMPRAMAAAFNEITHWIARGDIPRRRADGKGNRDDVTYRWFARMHGLGLSEARAAELYDFFLSESGGDPPDGWPDPKSSDKLRRIWEEEGAVNAAGSELPPAAAEIFKDFRSDQLSRDRLWTMSDLINLKPIEFWDGEKMLPRAQGGYVSVWFGKFGHHKTNLLLAKLFWLLIYTKAKVLYLIGEGVGGIGARLAAHCIAASLTSAEFDSRFRAQEIPLMSDPEQIAHLLELLRAEEYSADVVVIDTMTTALAGMDEDNKTASMLTRKGAIGRLATHWGSLVVLIGHEGEKPGKLRGASGYYGNADQVLYVLANADKHATAISVETKKMRDGQAGEWWYSIAHINGVPVPQACSQQSFEMLSPEQVKFSMQSIAGALGRLGASGIERGVTSRVVVQELYPILEGQDPEDWSRCIDAITRGLEKAAKGDALSGLYAASATGLVWFA